MPVDPELHIVTRLRIFAHFALRVATNVGFRAMSTRLRILPRPPCPHFAGGARLIDGLLTARQCSRRPPPAPRLASIRALPAPLRLEDVRRKAGRGACPFAAVARPFRTARSPPSCSPAAARASPCRRLRPPTPPAAFVALTRPVIALGGHAGAQSPPASRSTTTTARSTNTSRSPSARRAAALRAARSSNGPC